MLHLHVQAMHGGGCVQCLLAVCCHGKHAGQSASPSCLQQHEATLFPAEQAGQRQGSLLQHKLKFSCVQGQNLPFGRPPKGMHLPFKMQPQNPKQHNHKPVVVTLVLAEATAVATAVPMA